MSWITDSQMRKIRGAPAYNLFLLLKYNGHINVDTCTTVSAVKYLYKYVYKGHDKEIVEFKYVDNADNSRPKRKDEVTNYLEA